MRLCREHDEERRRVDGAEVALACGEGPAAAPPSQLVEDLPGLLLRHRVVPGPLELGEAGQDAAGQPLVERQRHPRGQQRVAAEQGHEPRRARRDDRAVGVGLVGDAERGQVGQGLLQHHRGAGVVGHGGGDGSSPLVDAAQRYGVSGFHAGREGQAARDAVDDRLEREGEDLLGPGGDLEPPRQLAAPPGRASSGVGREVHEGAHRLVVEGRQRPTAMRAPHRLLGCRPPRLHIEDVGEVRGHADAEGPRLRRRRRVVQVEVLPQSARDPPPARQHAGRALRLSDPMRATTTADRGVGELEANTSSEQPSSAISRRDRWRRSSCTSPWVGSRICPLSSLSANVRPSRTTNWPTQRRDGAGVEVERCLAWGQSDGATRSGDGPDSASRDG